MAPLLHILWRSSEITTHSLSHRQDSIPLASTLNGRVALCAQPCLINTVNQYWVPQPCANSSSSGISCLCDNYSRTGYTLGEVALQCTFNNCPERSTDQLTQARDICTSEAGAVPPTHSSVIVSVSVIFTSTETATMSSTRSSFPASSTTLSSTGAAATNASPATMSPTGGSPVPQSSISSATSVPASVASSTHNSTDSSAPSRLSTAQAAGITVGAFGGLGLAISLIFCCICCWRRKKRKAVDDQENAKKGIFKRKATKKQSRKATHMGKGDLETDKRYSLDFRCATTPRMAHSTPQGITRQYATGQSYTPAHDPFVAHNTRSQDRGFGYYVPPRKPTANQRSQAHDNDHLTPDVAATLPSSRTPSPYSTRSDRTVSRLLPDTRPVETTQANTSRPFSTTSRCTVFEEDQAAYASQPPRMPTIYQKDGPIALGDPRQAPRVVEVKPPLARRRSMRTANNLKLKLTIPPHEDAQPGQPSASATGRVLRSASALPSPGRRPHFASSTPAPFPSAGSNMSYLPSYYMSNDSRTPEIPLKSPARPAFDQSSWPIPKTAKLLPKGPPQESRLSRGSDTSFESVDPDEVTPPEETGKELNGPCSSPITNLRYPKVPRSANQAIPRTPLSSSLRGHQLSPIPSLTTPTPATSPVSPLGACSGWKGSKQDAFPAPLEISKISKPQPLPKDPPGITHAANGRGQLPQIMRSYSRRMDLD